MIREEFTALYGYIRAEGWNLRSCHPFQGIEKVKLNERKRNWNIKQNIIESSKHTNRFFKKTNSIHKFLVNTSKKKNREGRND